MTCPDPIRLEAFVDGELSADAAAAVANHLATCADCAAQVRRTRQLVALLHRQPAEELDENQVLRLVEEAKRGKRVEPLVLRTNWRRSLVAASIVVALSAGAVVAHRTRREAPVWLPPDSLSAALLREHQDYQAALAADPNLNVQVALLGW
ncbi:MAG: anti-sigma factor family protein [Betaproteobacteria bacterium]